MRRVKARKPPAAKVAKPVLAMLPGYRPFCKACGYAKGGIDSWDGQHCKCGLTEPPIVMVEAPPE